MRVINVCMCSVIALLCISIILQVASGSASPDCGTIDEVLAERDPRARVPWTASLYFQSTQCDLRPAGNGHGVIIGPTQILIKGNFLWSNDGYGTIRMNSYSPNHFMIAVGLKSKSPFTADQHTQFHKVANIQPHLQSFDIYGEYDYAIVHLKHPIQYSPFVRPICVDILPDETFDRSNNSFFNDNLMITGFRTGSGNTRSALYPDKDHFGLLPPQFCLNKLQLELTRASQTPLLIKADSPCGASSKSTDAEDDFLDVRSIIGESERSNRLLKFNNFFKYDMNFTYWESKKGSRPIQNICFHNGAAITTLYQGRFHLVGLVTESLGLDCQSNLYFLSFVASKNNLNWVLQHLRYGSDSFICSNGQVIKLRGSLCNGRQDCLDGSDEESKMCVCNPNCGSSRCILQPMCKHCNPSDSLKILGQRQTYKFVTESTPLNRNCEPIKATTGAKVYCKAPGLNSHIPCERQHFPGTQAVFTTQRFDSRTPALYCVQTCKEDGQWSDEANAYQCRLFWSQVSEDDVTIPIGDRAPIITQSTVPPVSSNVRTTIKPRRTTTKRITTSTTRRTTTYSTTPSTTTPTQTTPTDITFGGVFKDKHGNVQCAPIKPLKGTEVACWTNTSRPISCSEPMYPGTKAEYSCSKYYKPILSTASVIKQCQNDGGWSLSNRKFECRLDCGIPKTDYIGHIYNGRETDGARWPWHGLIFIDIGQRNFTYICGSTLISKRILVTAAHCVTDRNGKAKKASLFKVVLAATSNIYHRNIVDKNIQIFDISEVTVQPLFNVGNFEADIAILQLSRNIDVSDYVRPSCYPSTLGGHTELKHLSPGSLGTVVGFGYDESGKPSEVLKEASLPVVSYKDCYEVSKIQHSPTQYCAGYTNGTSVCNGDSGSGQFFEEAFPQRRFYFQGIVSHGNRDESSRLCDSNKYSVFTKVGSFKNWISETGYQLDDEF